MPILITKIKSSVLSHVGSLYRTILQDIHSLSLRWRQSTLTKVGRPGWPTETGSKGQSPFQAGWLFIWREGEIENQNGCFHCSNFENVIANAKQLQKNNLTEFSIAMSPYKRNLSFM